MNIKEVLLQKLTEEEKNKLDHLIDEIDIED